MNENVLRSIKFHVHARKKLLFRVTGSKSFCCLLVLSGLWQLISRLNSREFKILAFLDFLNLYYQGVFMSYSIFFLKIRQFYAKKDFFLKKLILAKYLHKPR